MYVCKALAFASARDEDRQRGKSKEEKHTRETQKEIITECKQIDGYTIGF
jgi:hypothetical protein